MKSQSTYSMPSPKEWAEIKHAISRLVAEVSSDEQAMLEGKRQRIRQAVDHATARWRALPPHARERVASQANALVSDVGDASTGQVLHMFAERYIQICGDGNEARVASNLWPIKNFGECARPSGAWTPELIRTVQAIELGFDYIVLRQRLCHRLALQQVAMPADLADALTVLKRVFHRLLSADAVGCFVLHRLATQPRIFCDESVTDTVSAITCLFNESLVDLAYRHHSRPKERDVSETTPVPIPADYRSIPLSKAQAGAYLRGRGVRLDQSGKKAAAEWLAAEIEKGTYRIMQFSRQQVVFDLRDIPAYALPDFMPPGKAVTSR